MGKHHAVVFIFVIAIIFSIILTCFTLGSLVEKYNIVHYSGTVKNYYKISQYEYCVNVEYENKDNIRQECTLFKDSDLLYDDIKILEDKYPINNIFKIRLKSNKHHCKINDTDEILNNFCFFLCVSGAITLGTGLYLSHIKNINDKIKRDTEFLKNAQKELQKLRNTTYKNKLDDDNKNNKLEKTEISEHV